jgi:hypothetical protein
MTDVQLAYTQLAFRELRQFSIPGIGTFVKKLSGAQVDMAQNVIYPPTERFEFTPGGATYTRHFVELLERRQHMDADAATQTVEELGQALLKQLKARKQVEIPGIGKLSLEAGDTLAFALTSQDPTLQTYGLSPVAYGGRTEEVLEKDLPKQKKKGGTPAPRKTETQDAKAQALRKQKRRTRVLAVVVLLLLGGLTAGVISVWPEIERQLFKGQVKADDILAEGETSEAKPAPKAAAESTTTPAPDDTATEDTEPAPEPQPEPKKTPVPAKKAADKPAPKVTPKPEPKTTPSPATTAETGNVTYRLVLAQTYSQAEVAEEKGFWVDYGGTVVPAGGGRYTIQFHSSKSRADVLAKQQRLIANGVFYHASQTRIVP